MFAMHNIMYIIIVNRKYHVILLYVEYEFMWIRIIMLRAA